MSIRLGRTALVASGSILVLSACQQAGLPVAPVANALGSGGTLTSLATSLATAVLGGVLTDEQEAAGALAERQALTSNAPVEWAGPGAQVTGVVQPLGTFTDREGRLCRTYTQQVRLGEQIASPRGTACRVGEGNWALASIE